MRYIFICEPLKKGWRLFECIETGYIHTGNQQVNIVGPFIGNHTSRFIICRITGYSPVIPSAEHLAGIPADIRGNFTGVTLCHAHLLRRRPASFISTPSRQLRSWAFVISVIISASFFAGAGIHRSVCRTGSAPGYSATLYRSSPWLHPPHSQANAVAGFGKTAQGAFQPPSRSEEYFPLNFHIVEYQFTRCGSGRLHLPWVVGAESFHASFHNHALHLSRFVLPRPRLPAQRGVAGSTFWRR